MSTTYIWPCGLHQAPKPCPMPICPVCERVLADLRREKGLGRILTLLEKRRAQGRATGRIQSDKAKPKHMRRKQTKGNLEP